MKKRLIVVLAVLAGLCAMTTTASAHEAYTNTCGSGTATGVNASSLYSYYEGVITYPTWHFEYSADCGYGGTTEYEIQRWNGTSFGDMYAPNGTDFADYQLSAPANGTHLYHGGITTEHPCNSNDIYRLKVYDGESTSPYYYPSSSGAPFC